MVIEFSHLNFGLFLKSSDFNKNDKNATGNTSITEIYWTHTHTNPFQDIDT